MSHASSRLLERIVSPDNEPITLEQAKLYLRIDSEAEDTLIESLIIAARESAEEYLQASLMPQRWKLAYADYLPDGIELPRGPVNSVISVTLVERDGMESELDDSVYYLNPARTKLCFDAEPIAHRVEVIYEAGYEEAEAVPAAIKQGMLMHLAALYGDRESFSMPAEAIAIYQPFRKVSL